MAGWQPAWRVLVAFNNGVFDDPALITTIASPPGTLGGANVWTDVTADVRDAVDTNRGRQHEIDRFQTGTLALTLDNRSGRYDPWNTSSPYTGRIAPGKPVRLQATDPNTSTTTALFTGVTDVWTTGWAAPRYATAQLSCVDWFAYMNNQYLSTSLYPKAVLADSPATYLRMGDPVGSGRAADSSGHGNSAAGSGLIIFGQTGAIQNNAGTGVDLANGGATPAAAFYASTAGGLTATGWTVECWYKTTSWSAWGGTTNILYYQIDTGGFGVVQVYVTPAGILNILDVTPGTGIVDLAVASASAIPADGNWHQLAVTSATPFMYLDGQPIAATVTTNTGVPTKTVALAEIASANFGAAWPGMLQEVALYNTVLSSARLLAHYNAGTAPAEGSGARIARIASWAAIPTANATIDTGKSVVQAITAALTTTTSISYQQLVEQTEDGAFFITGAGQLRFMSRDAVYTNITSTVTFGDGGGAEIPFELAPTIALDTLDQYVSTSIQRNGGNTQIADTGQLGKQYQQSGLLQTNDTEVLGLANWLLGQFSITPKPRIRSITVHPVVIPTGAATTALLGLELGAVVTVNRHTLPGAGTAFTQTCNVEGINHHIDPNTGDWNVLLQLTPLPPQRPWIWGTSQWSTDTNWFF